MTQQARSAEGLLLLAALASIRLAQGLTGEQIELLSAFFTVLGENLALLGAVPAAGGESGAGGKSGARLTAPVFPTGGGRQNR